MEGRVPNFFFRSTDGKWSFHLPAGGEVVVGRGPGVDVPLPFMALSRRHMRLVHRGADCAVEHLEARGSIYIKGRGIHGQGLVPLQVGDRVELLGELLTFVVESSDRDPATGD